MDLDTIIFPNVQPNFLNLSLLICHLFAGGNFRIAHILYHQKAIDDDFLKAVDATCPFPMMTSDIAAPSSNSSDQSQRTDHILQLIFLPRNQLATSMDRIDRLLTFYRIFIFLTNEEPTDCEHKWLNESKHISKLNSTSLLLIHDKSNGTTQSFLLSKNRNVSMEPIDLSKSQLRTEIEIFNVALGEKAHDQEFGVSQMEMMYCGSSNTNLLRTILRKFRMFGRFYSNRFNMSFMDSYSMNCNHFGLDVNHEYVRPIQKSSYNELSTEVEPIALDSK